ncbi:MAG: hypothetical protein LBD44_01375 [Spirochaetaceae bacterium]|jgi:hypothetical protein|nr:hypothetical protein [Spirochaetaceae bacterium]
MSANERDEDLVDGTLFVPASVTCERRMGTGLLCEAAGDRSGERMFGLWLPIKYILTV